MNIDIIEEFAKIHPFQLDSKISGSICNIYNCGPEKERLIGIFCLNYFKWEGRKIVINEKNCSDPWVMDNLDDFIISNATVNAFRIALSRNLSNLSHSKEEASRIVEEAAKRIFPDFFEKSCHAFDKIKSKLSEKTKPPSSIPEIRDDSPIWLLPMNIENTSLDLMKECLEMLVKIPIKADGDTDKIRWYKKNLSHIKKRIK